MNGARLSSCIGSCIVAMAILATAPSRAQAPAVATDITAAEVRQFLAQMPKNEGGVPHRVDTGDVLIIPGGVPHWWSKRDGDVTYLNIRMDPENVLKLK